MTITQITVHASTSFNHPHEQYANFKPGVTLTATINEAHENFAVATKELQHVADDLVAKEKTRILGRINLKREIAQKESYLSQIKADEQSNHLDLEKLDAALATEWDGKPVTVYDPEYFGRRNIGSMEELEDVKNHARASRDEMLECIKTAQADALECSQEIAALNEKLLTLK